MYSWRVPFNVFGELKIVPASTKGEPMADAECVPTVIQWHFSWLLPRLLPWLAFLPVLLWRTVRDRRNLWVLAPVAVVQCTVMMARDFLSVASDDVLLCFSDTVGALGLGLGVVWLLLEILAQKTPRPHTRFAVMALVLGANGALGVVGVLGTGEFAVPGLVAAILSLVTSFVFAFALRMTVKTSRQRTGFLGFAVRLAGFASLGPTIILLPPAFLVYALLPRSVVGVEEVLISIPILSFIFGITLSVITLPFLALTFLHEAFAAHFCACFGFNISADIPPKYSVPNLFKRRRKFGGIG